MKKRSGSDFPAFIIPLLILAAIAVLYFFLRSALPQYAGRVPLLAVLFLFDWFLYRDIRKIWDRKSSFAGSAFAVFWWMPFALLFVFLIFSAIIPLQEWNDWPRIYLPGIALIMIASKLVMFSGLIPAYLIQLLLFLSGRASKKNNRRPSGLVHVVRVSGVTLGLATFVLLATGSIYWVYRFQVHEVSIRVKNLPPQFEGLKIVQLSDIHLGDWVSEKPLQRAMNKVLELQPDLIVFTGDLVNYSTGEALKFGPVLSQLHAPLGVYAILGNHDYGDYTAWSSDSAKQQNMQQLEAFYRETGWKLLRNQSELIRVDSAALLLAGVENWSATPRFRRYGDMTKTMEGHTPAQVNILLSHDPTHWDAEVTSTYPFFDLMLSGHTHGMQLGIEECGISWSPAEYIYKEWAGLYSHRQESGKINYLYVNRGLGHIGYPGRVGILPEITLITLIRGEE